MNHILFTSVKTRKYGASRMTWHYASALLQAGYRVSLAYELDAEAGPDSDESIIPEMREIGVECVRVPRLRITVGAGRKQLDRLLRSNETSLIISTQIGCVPATLKLAKRHQIPSVVFAQNLTRFTGNPLSKWIKERVYCSSLRRHATKIICVAPGIRLELIERFGVPEDKVFCVMNGLDLEKIPKFSAIDRVQVRQEFKLNDNEKLLLSIGRIHVQKGLDVLMESVRHLKANGQSDFKLLLVGDVESDKELPLKRTLQAYVRDNGLSELVVFAGFRKDCWRLLSAADVYVLSSRWEGLPLVLLEAMASECPILMTEYGERFEGFNAGTDGVYVAKDNPLELAAGIKKYLDLPVKEIQSIGRNGRKYLETHLSLTAGKRQFVKILESLLYSETGIAAPQGFDQEKKSMP